MQDDLSLEQLVSFSTRGEKTLDLVFMTHPSLVDKCKPLPSVGKSDHDIVLVDLCISPTIAKPNHSKGKCLCGKMQTAMPSEQKLEN